MAQSLEEMAEELTCSICLCLFSTPVTIPCGHNFCTSCLELTWKDPDQGAYTCPQCRYSFSSKPELRKNTLLSNLVNLAQAARGEETTSDPEPEETKSDEEPEEEEKEGTVLCDSCRKTAAAKTCLTCMASFCQDHLLPHQQSPVFADHQLIQPIGDLQKRKCTEHNKLIDHYCWEHSKCICCYCALTHKVCQTYTLEEGKKKKEQYYTNLLRALNQKIDKATNIAEEVQFDQRKKMENTKQKKELLETEFEEIKALIEEEQNKAMVKLGMEEKRLNNQFSYTQNVLSKKKKEFEFVRNKVQSLLQEEDDLQFLKRATKLKDTTSKEPFHPRVNVDEKLLHSIYRNVVSLKENIKFKINAPEESQDWRPRKAPEQGSAPEDWRQRKTPEPGPVPEQDRSGKWKPGPPPSPHKSEENSKQDKPPKKNKPKPPKPFANPPPAEAAAAAPPHAKPQRAPRASSAAPLESREQLLKYAERTSVNPQTAHKKIALFENFTRMAVSDIPQNYGDNPQRFVSCSQALCARGFSSGIHYWEVEKEGGNFSGFGVAYQSIVRSGTESRLGRNKVSWCIEWCNGKLQAWHDDRQTDLTTPNTNKFGVLLNMEEGYIAFFCIGKKCSQIFKFRAKFTEAVYPAFWMFASNTILTLCQTYTLEF